MSTPAPQPRTFPFEARPLFEPVDPRAVQRFHEELKRRSPGFGLNVTAIVLLVIGGIVVAGALLPMLFAFGAFAIATAGRGGAAGLLPVVLIVLIVSGIAVGVFFLVRANLSSTKERRYRLDRFARANAMSYLPNLAEPRLPGMIFNRGSSRAASDLVRGEQPRFVEFANYQYTTGSGKEQTTHRWGYVAIHLGTPLPHIVLDAVGNNSVFGSNLPAQFAKAQRLSLEGDFDRYFTLYCPEGYERDALYLFTPDIMSRFIDNVAQLDVEIVDDWMFLYTGRPVSTTDAGTWAWLFSAVSALMDKLAQWQRWRDERLAAEHARAVAQAQARSALAASSGAPLTAPLPFHTTMTAAPPPAADWLGPKGVAQPGRRLRGGFPWVAVVGILAVVGLALAPILFGVIGVLLHS
ncbi:hypothetical protein [Microbacterium sp.]|uniref:hypothetical protein n=1 Tax=Microbacterium sp. TaxID=51671 RepID=UPI00281129AF|nr:hypothetical protein [Microbacterium sp.]